MVSEPISQKRVVWGSIAVKQNYIDGMTFILADEACFRLTNPMNKAKDHHICNCQITKSSTIQKVPANAAPVRNKPRTCPDQTPHKALVFHAGRPLLTRMIVCVPLQPAHHLSLNSLCMHLEFDAVARERGRESH